MKGIWYTIDHESNLIKDFVETWIGRGYEKGEAQPFWLALLHHVLGIEAPEKMISFEDQVHLDHTSFIDAYIPSTKVLIEQKSLGKELDRPIKQSDGSSLTPFQQAKRYSAELPYSQRPRWIVVCNFAEFHVYDMEQPHGEPEIVLLKDMAKEAHRENDKAVLDAYGFAHDISEPELVAKLMGLHRGMVEKVTDHRWLVTGYWWGTGW